MGWNRTSQSPQIRLRPDLPQTWPTRLRHGRRALLTAALSLETGLTDSTLLMFDKLMGSLSRKAERRSQEKAAKGKHH